MSIQDQIGVLVKQGRLFLLGENEESPRLVYHTVEVKTMIDDALGDTREAELHAAATVVLESFVDGSRITICGDPYNKERHTILARTDPGAERDHPVTSEIWDFRCLDPVPGIRVLGCFGNQDVFVALIGDYRQNFDDHWPEQIERCKEEWIELFGKTPPHKGRQLNDYVSHNFEIS
jgi:hypothetical protein